MSGVASPVLADVLTAPSEVISIVAGWITVRGAMWGAFVALVQRRSAREIADQTALAMAASVPQALLLGFASILYLVAR